MSADLNQVLESFSVNQLRDLAFAMSSRGLPPPKATMGRDSLRELINRKSSDTHLALYAHRIEAVTPYKHLFLYSLDTHNADIRSATANIESAYPNLVGGFRKIEAYTDELEPQACLADDSQQRIYLKLVHQVEMSGWVLVSPKQKEFKEFRKRHPVVITLRIEEGIVTVAFPGFTYGPGLQRDDRLQYAAIAEMGIGFLKDKLRITCNQFQAKPAIDTLLQDEPDEVVDIKRIVRPQKGGRFSFDAGEESKLTVALTDYFQTEGGIKVDEKQMRELLRSSAASDIVLHWKKSDLITRVALMSHGAELLFIWRDAGPSSSLVDMVLRKIVKYSRLVTRPAIQTLRRNLLSSPVGKVVEPAIVAQANGVSTGEVVQILDQIS